MRTYDLATWLAALDGPPTGLPGGDGAVVVGADSMTVTVQWQDDRNPAAGPLQITVTTSF